MRSSSDKERLRPTARSFDYSGNRASNFSFDAFGLTGHILRTEALTAICLLIIATCAMGMMLYFLRGILLPFAIAIFLMYILQPMVNYLAKPPRRWCDKCYNRHGEACCESLWNLTKSRRTDEERQAILQQQQHHMPRRRRTCLDYPLIPRWVAVLLAIAFALAVMFGLGVIVYTSFEHIQNDFPKYEEGVRDVADRLRKFLGKYGYSLDSDVVPFVLARLRAVVPHVLAMLLDGVVHALYVAVFLVYLLISPRRPVTKGVWGQIDLHIRRYIRLKTAICVGVGLSVGLLLWGLNVQLAWVFGLITFVLNYVPNIGPILATALPMPVAIFNPDLSATAKVMAFVLPTIVHLVVGNFVEPRTFGETFELTPLIVLLSLAFWGSLWGIPGMILSVPLIVCLRIVCLHLEHPYARTAVAILEGRLFETRIDENYLVPGAKASWDAAAASFSATQEGEDAEAAAEEAAIAAAEEAAVLTGVGRGGHRVGNNAA